MMMIILSFILIVFPIVIIHEFGHFIVGKYLGAEPKSFSVGFGKPLLKFNWDGTEFRVGWIPLGGYVEFGKYQLDPEKKDEAHKKLSPQKWIPIILAGPVFNLVTAFVSLTVVFTYILTSVQIATVSSQMVSENKELRPESKIVYLGDNDKITKFIGGLFQTEEKYFLVKEGSSSIKISEISGKETLDYKKIGFTEALTNSMSLSGLALIQMAKFTVIGIKDVFTSLTGYKNLSGPIGISVEASKAREKGLLDVVLLFAIISFAVGFFNLLPLSILDGGRIVFAVVEIVTKRSVPVVLMGVFNIVSLGLLLSLFLMGTISDILRLKG